MKWLIASLFVINTAWAEYSKIVPSFLEAAEIYVKNTPEELETLVLRPDIKAVLKVLSDAQIDPHILERRIDTKSSAVELRADDQYDGWIENPDKSFRKPVELAVQAFRLDVVDASDGWLKDDVYAYFFITDGVIPTGKVTSIYKGVGSGESFFFNQVDRAIFPLIGVPAKAPENHLIIDYGIIESDGDDVKEMQKLSAIIIDIAISVYASYNPQSSQVIVSLRKEIKALADLLLSLNSDDRLVTGSLGWKSAELERMLRTETYVELKKTHQSGGQLTSWQYDLWFRILKK